MAGALARGDAAPALARATAHSWMGHLELWSGDSISVRKHYETCLAIGRAVGDKQTIATALRGMGDCLIWQSQRDYGRAGALFDESLALFREVGDVWNLGMGLQ